MRYYFILILAIVLVITSCSSDSSTGPSSSSLDSNLVGHWVISSWVDEDGDQDYPGYIKIFDNKDFEGQVDDDDIEHIFSGTVTSSSNKVTFTITETNSMWFDEGSETYEYNINNNILTIQGEMDDEETTIKFEKQINDFGGLSGTVTSQNQKQAITGVLIEVIGTDFEANTDNEGNYSIENIPIGSYEVKASKDGYISATESISITKDEISTLDFVLSEGVDQVGNLEGLVSNYNAIPMEGVLVEILGTSLEFTTSFSGNYQFSDLEIGIYSVRFSKEDYETIVRDNIEITAQNTTQLNITLVQPSDNYGSVSGFVISFDDQTIMPDANISILGTSFTATTDQYGYYEINNIPVGVYDIKASKNGYDDNTLMNIEIIGNVEATADFVMFTSGTTPYGTIQGIVTDEITGQPLVNVAVTSPGLTPSLTTIDGSYRLIGLTNGSYDVTFTKLGYQTKTVEGVQLSVGSQTELNVTME